MASEDGSEATWQVNVVEEFRVPDTNQIWQTQIVTAPDGKKMAGIRKLIRKANGSVVRTSAGFLVPLDEIAARLLRKHSVMLQNLASHLDEGKS